MAKVAVVAVGGNSIIKPGQKGTMSEQWEAAKETCEHIASMIQQGYNVIITHGNGPQVGNILLRAELSSHVLPSLPLDVCGADSQGAMGYMIQQLLGNILKERKIDKEVATIVTQVAVAEDDPAFKNPSKPIGPFYDKEKALKHKEEEAWDIVEDAGRGYRRVVASPIPMEIVEEKAIKTLIDAGYILVAVGGGGIPVVKKANGNYKGVSAVIDKDYASSLLASNIKADLFMISTAVEKVYLNYNKPDQKGLDKITLSEAKKYLSEGHFAKGSMGPKIQAIIWFLERGGQEAIVTCPEAIERALKGETGTRIVKD